MRNISLLPAEIKRKIVLARKWSIAATIGVILAIIFIFGVGATKLLTISPLIELNSIQEEIQTVDAQIKELKPYENKLKAIKLNIQQYEKAKGNRPSLNVVIFSICNKIPDDIKLTKMDGDFSSSEYRIVVEGTASNQKAASAWFRDLKDNENVGEVYCKSLNSVSKEDRSVKFTLEIPIKGGDNNVQN